MSLFYKPEFLKDDYIFHKGSRVVGNSENRQLQGQISVPQLGTPFNLDIIQNGRTFIKKCNFEFTVSAVTTTGGTFRRLPNGAHWFFDRIELYHGSELISTQFPSVMHAMLYQHNDFDEFGVIAPADGILSVADRNAASASTQTFTLPMDELFSLFSKPLPYWQYTAANLQFRFHWRQAGQIVETDGTSPVLSVLRANMNVSYVEPAASVAKYVDDIYKTGGMRTLMFHYDFINVTQPLAAGQNQFAIALQTLNNYDVIYLNFMTRLNTDLVANAFTNFQTIGAWNLKSASRYINGTLFDVTPQYFQQTQLEEYAFRGGLNLRTLNLYSINYSYDLNDAFGENNNDYCGSRDFRGVTDAMLNLTYPTALGAAQTLTVDIIRAEMIVLMNGQLKKL